MTRGILHGIFARKRCITTLYLPLGNKVTNAINATYAQCTIGRLSVISNVEYASSLSYSDWPFFYDIV